MLQNEGVYTFTQISKRLPTFNGKRVHVSTIHRWCRKGVKGVRLEFRVLGGRLVTSMEAVDRFSKALSELETESVLGAFPRRVSVSEKERRRRAEMEKAEAYLIAKGA